MKKTVLYTALLCIGLTPHVAHAQLIERVCGHVPCTFDEFKAAELVWFQKADANHDGIIDANEQSLMWQNNARDVLPSCKDMQGVKVLTLNHLPTEAESRKNFDVIDTNKDGMIDQKEDQQITLRINMTCGVMHSQEFQKMKQILMQMNQDKTSPPQP